MFRKTVIGFIVGAMALSTSVAFGDSTLTSSSYIGFSPTSGSINSSGLGWVSQTYGVGNYQARAYFDLELDTNIPELNTGVFNEFVTATGTKALGQSWEAGVPNFPHIPNDIYDHFLTNALSNSVTGDIDPSSPNYWSNDVAMAMAWDFTVDPGYTKTLTFYLTDSVNPDALPSFFLTQTDDLTGNSVYFYSDMKIEGGGGNNEVVPEPSTFALLSSALAGLGFFVRKRRNA